MPSTPPAQPRTARPASPALSSFSSFRQVVASHDAGSPLSAIKPAGHATAMRRSPLKTARTAAVAQAQTSAAHASGTPRSPTSAQGERSAWKIASIRDVSVPVAPLAGTGDSAREDADDQSSASATKIDASALLSAAAPGAEMPREPAHALELAGVLKDAARSALRGWVLHRQQQLEHDGVAASAARGQVAALAQELLGEALS